MEKIRNLPHYELSGAVLTKAQQGIYKLGYGLTKYDGQFDVDGKLRMGLAGISDVSDKTYSTYWRMGTGWAGGAPGDSGGPLMSLDEERLVLHGVASNIVRSRNQQGETEKVWTNYTRLDHPAARDWITSTTGRSYRDDAGSAQQAPVSGNTSAGTQSGNGSNGCSSADGAGDGQFVGVYRCKSASSASPYWILDLNFNDPVYVEVTLSRFASESSDVTPAVRSWMSDVIYSFGTMLAIANTESSERIHFEVEANLASVTDVQGQSLASDLQCVKQ